MRKTPQKTNTLGFLVLCWKKPSCKSDSTYIFHAFCKILMSRKPIHVMIWKKTTSTFRNLNPERRRGPAQIAFRGKRLERLTSLNKQKTAWMFGEKFLKSMNHIGWNFLEYDICLTVWPLYFKCLFWFDMFLFDFVWPCFFLKYF